MMIRRLIQSAPRRFVLAAALTASLTAALMPHAASQAASQTASQTATPPAASGTLKPFADEAELQQVLAQWRAEAEKRQRASRRAPSAMVQNAAPAPMSAAPPPPSPAAAPVLAESAAKAKAEDGITNVQTAGVDEGGIVKRAGDHLIVLRRGRLFTVRVGSDDLRPVAMADAYAPDADPRGAWYDELLISGNTVVVVGYSYARGGTEIGLFELNDRGGLSYRATYHLRSFDYYSSRNYASQLIGRKLVFYSPMMFISKDPPTTETMPGMRRWQGAATPPKFERILPATRVYRSDDEFDPGQPLALHTITSCELGGAAMRCESTAVLGPTGRVFYVSQGAVYVWTTAARRTAPVPAAVMPAPAIAAPVAPSAAAPSVMPPVMPPVMPTPPAPVQPVSLSSVFRIPLDGSAPTGLKTAGVPIDQMSFLEDGQGFLNVLLRESGRGEGMWGSELTRGGVALLRVPLVAFGDGRGSAQREHYRVMPAAAGYAVQNRFIGDWLLWSAGHDGRSFGAASRGAEGNAWALRYAEAAPPVALAPPHGVQRIEALRNDAVLVGPAGADLHFSAVRLTKQAATLSGRHVQADAQQGEARTHGFFYRATADDEGLLGLPILGTQPRGAVPPGVHAGAQGSASVLFLRQRQLGFRPLGELEAATTGARNDGCKASCVDWYGNARPIFLGERVFALMGYELVEGRLAGKGRNERIEERRRISFAPVAAPDGRYSPFGQ